MAIYKAKRPYVEAVMCIELKKADIKDFVVNYPVYKYTFRNSKAESYNTFEDVYAYVKENQNDYIVSVEGTCYFMDADTFCNKYTPA